MPLKPNSTVYFELKGRALDAARQLKSRLRQEMDSIPPHETATLKRFYEVFTEKLEKESPELLTLTGLKSPSIQIFRKGEGLPRAYESCPMIFLSPDGKPRYFMSAPVDYKGMSFQPLDSIQLNEKQTENVENLLFAGGWLTNPSLFPAQKKGIETPVDGTPSKTETLKDYFNAPSPVSCKCFIASGRSLDIFLEIRRKEKSFHSAFRKLGFSIEEASRTLFPDMLKELPSGEDLYARTTYSYPMAGGKANIELSVCRRGGDDIMGDDIMDAGKRVPLIDNPYFAFTLISNERYAIHPKGDTPEGQEILALFNALPEKPGVAQYPELHMPVQNSSPLIPHARIIETLSILMYTSDQVNSSSFCPPDSIPISTALYEWMNDDLFDRGAGIIPPPIPEILRNELSSPVAFKKPPGYDAA